MRFINASVASPFSEPDRSEHLSSLDLNGLLILFPTTIEIVDDHGGRIVLADSPLLGVVEGIVSATGRASSGHSPSTYVDFYGEFSITISIARGRVECVNKFDGSRVSADESAFIEQLSRWAKDAFVELERSFGDLGRNPSFVRLRDVVTEEVMSLQATG